MNAILKNSLAGDAFALAYSDRCRICALPLPPRSAGEGICSRRCAGLRGESAAVEEQAHALMERLLAEVARLRRGTTVCPVDLAQRVLPQVAQALTVLRPLIFELAESGRLRLSQKGALVRWPKISGPFRIGPK